MAQQAEPVGVQDTGPRRYAMGTFDLPYYTIAKGDALSVIAERFGVDMEAIQQENGLRNPDDIKAGSKLRIPGTQPTSPQTQLSIGQLAYVDFSQPRNAMRSEPRIPSGNPLGNVVDWIPPGYVVKIVGGSRKDQDRVWWEVQSPRFYGGRKAWTAENEGRDRYLKPLEPFDYAEIRLVEI
jgi:LysM repeat protein